MSRKSKKAIIEAIKDSGGIMSTIARRLGVTWHTADTWVKQYDETKQALQDEREAILDLAESTLFRNIKDGNSQDAKWLLSTMGKNRGYSERHEITGADSGPIDVNAIIRKAEEEFANEQRNTGEDSQ
jgi:transposase-like protein